MSGYSRSGRVNQKKRGAKRVALLAPVIFRRREKTVPRKAPSGSAETGARRGEGCKQDTRSRAQGGKK